MLVDQSRHRSASVQSRHHQRRAAKVAAAAFECIMLAVGTVTAAPGSSQAPAPSRPSNAPADMH